LAAKPCKKLLNGKKVAPGKKKRRRESVGRGDGMGLVRIAVSVALCTETTDSLGGSNRWRRSAHL